MKESQNLKKWKKKYFFNIKTSNGRKKNPNRNWNKKERHMDLKWKKKEFEKEETTENRNVNERKMYFKLNDGMWERRNERELKYKRNKDGSQKKINAKEWWF